MSSIYEILITMIACYLVSSKLETSEKDVDKTTLETSEEDDKTPIETSEEDAGHSDLALGKRPSSEQDET